MCGLIGGIGVPRERALDAVAHRGPDARGAVAVGPYWLGHTRLAVLDLDARSDQPFAYGSVTLSYNGELWNHDELRAELRLLGRSFATPGDTEVVAAALDEWGVGALARMNGMFALAWVGRDGVLRLARDRYGEVPLHYVAGAAFAFSSELKGLQALGARAPYADVGPGEVVSVAADGSSASSRWYDAPCLPVDVTLDDAAARLRVLVVEGAQARAISDVPVCTLLSGGIDSAAVAWALARVVPDLTAFVAVMDPKSPDVRAARETAEAIGIRLIEVAVAPPTPEDLARVVRVVEMPFKAQVEIGWACCALADEVGRRGFKVVFSGEGSDELWASYGFAYHALQREDWHAYRKRLFLDQARKNFARCNKVFMSRGVECRLPFLHPPLVEHALSLPRAAVQVGKSRLKAVMQEAFRGVLPARVVDRQKLAFQDGLGLKAAVAAVIHDPRRYYQSEFDAFARGG